MDPHLLFMGAAKDGNLSAVREAVEKAKVNINYQVRRPAQ
jgi:hypothetical protein